MQTVVAGRAPAPVPHVREREAFPLRGLILCKDCGKAVTASLSTGKLGNKFGYYRCHRVKGQLNVKAELVESLFVDLLQPSTPKRERLALIRKIFRASWKDKTQAASVKSTSLRRELAKQMERKHRVLEQVASGIINAEDFETLHKRTVEAIADLRVPLTASES